jgi:sterol O-acyltransferase
MDAETQISFGEPDIHDDHDTSPSSGAIPPNKTSSLRDALHTAHAHIDGFGPPSESASEEDYDAQSHTRETIIMRRRRRGPTKPAVVMSSKRLSEDLGSDITAVEVPTQVDIDSLSKDSSLDDLQPLSVVATTAETVDDKEFRDMLRRGLERARKTGTGLAKRRGKFGDLVFTRSFSAFDRQNAEAARSPFHGFYTLFWVAVFMFVLKIAATNWRTYGSLLGTNEIMEVMFRRDGELIFPTFGATLIAGPVIVLLLSDGIMCGLTGVSWLFQLLVYYDYVDVSGYRLSSSTSLDTRSPCTCSRPSKASCFR